VAGVFPTASTPTASTSSLTAPPPGPGTFPSMTLSNEFVKVRFFEENAAEAINRRWLGMPRGVYLGFNPSVSAGSPVLTLSVDASHNFSLLRVPSGVEAAMVDIFTASPITLDFTAHQVFPVYVLATADYRENSPTQGRIFTRAAGPTSETEVLICMVDKSGDDLVVSSLSPTTRQPPVAFNSQPYGYMPADSIDDLAATNASVAEVIAARNSSFTGPHASLDGRIDADITGEAMADRLGLRLVHLISNTHLQRTGSSPNVSASFTETGREFGPNFTIGAGGNETTEGAVTDITRGFCFVIDAQTKKRIVSATTKEPVFGTLSFTQTSLGAGKEIQFTNASTAVNGNGTNPFASPLQEGDIVQGPDGLFYEVESFTDPDNAVLGAAFQGTSGSITNSLFRRWLLFLATASGGAFSLSSATDIQFVFPSFFRTDRAIFDGYLLIKQDGESPSLEVATSTEAGKALLATPGGLVGSVRTIEDSNTPIGNDFHTLNFIFGGATNAGSGVLNVSVPGATGPAGTPSNTGPPGATGPAGFGYSVNNSFEGSAETGDTFTAVGPVTLSFTNDWTSPSSTPTFASLSPRSYAHVSGGWAKINGFTTAGFERIHIDELTDVDADRTRITIRIQPDPNTSLTTLKAFMGASQ